MPQRQRWRGSARRRWGRRRHIQRFLEPCLLLLLRSGRSHGYELAQSLAPFGFEQIDASLVYRMLREMEGAGWVQSAWDPTVAAGPARRVYHLTPEGEHHLSVWAGDLRQTDGVLHHFLDTYEQQGGESSDDNR